MSHRIHNESQSPNPFAALLTRTDEQRKPSVWEWDHVTPEWTPEELTVLADIVTFVAIVLITWGCLACA